ncbi:MAG: protease, partial [candidate division Zixibacteria bacterium]|nr:protease [candidate division Zixibacteria bacterium]
RTWKRYKGGMAQDVWIFDLSTFESEKITDWEGTDNMPMWYKDKIYFASDETGVLNIFSYDTNSLTTKQVTDFTEYDVRWPSLGTDAIAFENAGYLYLLELPSEKVRKVDITLSTDYNTTRSEYVSVSDKIRDFDISPDAKRAVFSARGDLFTVPAKEGNTRNLTNSSEAKEGEPIWSPDGKWIAYNSDESGEEEFYIISHEGKDKTRLTTNGYCHKYASAWSPDSKKLIFSDKELDFFYIDIGSKKLNKIDKANRNEIRDFTISPDSRYVAYTKNLENRITTIFIYSFEDKSIKQVTPGFTHDFTPLFDPDGKYLYFLSQRDFNPILGNYEFSFVNQAITNLFLIVLSADEKSPFAPKSDEVAIKDDDDEDDKDDDKDDDKPTKIKIDFEGIYDRQVAIDLPAGNYGGMSAVSGAVFYASFPMFGLRGKVGEGETVLHKYILDDKKDHVFAEGIDRWSITYDGKSMLIRKQDNYYIVPTSGEKANLEKPLDLTGMETKLDRRAEFKQIFYDVWRMERDFFYDKNMHGVDWDKQRQKYEVLLPYVSTRKDLTYLIGEMIGELCCSHTYVGGGDYKHIPSSEIGLLGVDFDFDKKNERIKFGKILQGENYDEDLRSPLLEPGIDIKEGDYLLAINGKELTADLNPYSLTENTVGKTITLTISDKPNMKKAREVTVKPIASEESLRYYNWVLECQSRVDSLSGGKIGYIHVPDMDSYGLFRFTKMYYHQFRKPGLILDVRYNGGGFVSQLILERLRREVKAMGASRTFEVGRAPGGGINAHMITLLNEFSCSDGDYFPYFFREYGLGPLMGMRSWGGVVGIRGYRPLVDGGYYTAPEFSIYSLEGKWVMENVGVVPDIEMDNLPDRKAQGYDDQLDAAIDYIMMKIRSDPKEFPPHPGPPAER